MMKKFYFLSILCCLSFAVFAQTTVTIYSTGIASSFTTGTATSTTRTGGNITSTAASTRGYAVFDLSSIPSGATITSVIIGFNVSAYFGGGGPSGWNTYGYAGDLSAVTTPSMLFADMVAGTSLSTASYGTSTGNQTLTSTAASVSFVQTNTGSTVSICWTGGNTKTYIITGETGSAATSGTHAPYLQVTYTCAGVSGVTASAPPSPICIGSSLTLTGNATGATSYSWSGPGPFSSTQQNPTFTTTAASAGVYTLTAYNSGGCGTSATTSAVVLNATPTASITPNTTQLICSGTSTLLTGTAGAGYTYQWYESGTAISGETNQTYSATTNGSYTILITDPSTGCSSTSPATDVSVIPLGPSLIPATSAHVCIGGSLTLGVDLSGITTGIAYQWEIGGIALPGATNSTYTTSSNGTYNCVLTLPTCGVTSQATVVTVLPLPTPSVTYSSGILRTSTTYAGYQWFLNLTAIPGATSATYIPPINGSYRVIVTDTNGCSNYSGYYTLSNVSVQSINVADIKIYPNPVSKTVHITSSAPVRTVIMSIEGKKILEQNNGTDINISELPNGLYQIILYNDVGERVMIDKLIKE